MIRLLLALLLLWTPLPAAAHAGLLETQPPDGARLDVAPPEVRLRFNEPVTPIVLRLIDGAGRERRLAPVADGETLRAPLPPDLPEGAYTLGYRVTSADAHPVAGAIVFGIGIGVDAAAPGDGTAADGGDGLAAAGAILRALANGATLLLAGGVLARLLLGAGTAAREGRWLAPLAILGHGGGVWLQGGALLGQGAAGLATLDAWRLGLASTRGPSFAALTLGVGLLALAGPRRPVLAAGLVAVLAAYLLTGHAASAPPEGLAKPLLAVHVAAAGFWIGALPILSRALAAPGAAALLARFSHRALGLVPLLLLAGIGLGLMQGVTPATLLAHPYGQLLAVKLACVVGVLALAALNRVRLTPGLAGGGAPTPLRRSIAAEGVLMAGLLLVTAFLSQTAPPRAAPPSGHVSGHASGHEHAHGHAPEGFTSLAPLGDRQALLTLTPARPGGNRLTLRLTDAGGTPRPPLAAVAFLSLPAAGIENLRRPLAHDGDGFAADLPLPTPGEWQVTVEILVTNFEKRSLSAIVLVR